MPPASPGPVSATCPRASWPSTPATRSEEAAQRPVGAPHGRDAFPRDRHEQQGHGSLLQGNTERAPNGRGPPPGGVNWALAPLAGSPLIRSLALLLSCAAVLAAGCSKEPESTPVAPPKKPAVAQVADRDEHS